MHTPTSASPHLRRLALLEGATLMLLLAVAVPLKHLAGWPQAVTVMGPVHGLAFLAYLWALTQAAAAGRWPWRDTAALLLAALVPFGAWAVTRRRGAPA